MSNAKACLEMLRPFNCIFAAASVLVGIFVESSSFNAVLTKNSFFAFFAVFFICAAGNVLNDYFDINSDKLNKPSRPIPSGRISLWSAAVLGFVLSAAGVLAAYMLNKNAMLLALVNLAILYAYSKIKEKTPFGNVIVAYLSGAVFLFAGLSVGSLAKVGYLALLSGLATLGREITKDIEDVKGDKFRKTTLATYYGDRVAGAIGGIVLVLAMLLSALPMKFFSSRYLYAVFIADTIFAYCAYRLVADPAKYASDIQRLEKVGMLAALIAFLLGAA